MSQLQLETMLDTPIKLSLLLKNKGKKYLFNDLKQEMHTKLMK